MDTIDYIKLVEFATKAPSGHNSQPWEFRTIPNAIEIHPDYSRSLAVVDPDKRELFISLGCAAENIVLAAKGQGLDSRVEMSANGDAVIVRFTNTSATDDHWLPLIENRQSNRSVYSGESLPASVLESLRGVQPEPGVISTIVTEDSQKDQLIKLVEAANEEQMRNAAFKDELLSWIRFNGRETRTKRDGLSYAALRNPSLPSRAIGKLIAGFFLRPDKQNQRDDRLLAGASALMVFAVQENDRQHWVRLGRYFERVALVATELGVAHSHFNQPFEVPVVRERIEMLDFIDGGQPCLMIRLGYAAPAPRSYRRRVTEVLLPN